MTDQLIDVAVTAAEWMLLGSSATLLCAIVWAIELREWKRFGGRR